MGPGCNSPSTAVRAGIAGIAAEPGPKAVAGLAIVARRSVASRVCHSPVALECGPRRFPRPVGRRSLLEIPPAKRRDPAALEDGLRDSRGPTPPVPPAESAGRSNPDVCARKSPSFPPPPPPPATAGAISPALATLPDRSALSAARSTLTGAACGTGKSARVGLPFRFPVCFAIGAAACSTARERVMPDSASVRLERIPGPADRDCSGKDVPAWYAPGKSWSWGKPCAAAWRCTARDSEAG
jgi:hypothetical protein